MIRPLERPKQERERSVEMLAAHSVDILKPAILMIRGYYKKSMGDPHRNDRGIYDDAAFLVTPTCYRTFTANADPSVGRPGIAVVKPGVHPYRLGYHKQGLPQGDPRRHRALRPATEGERLPVWRDGQDPNVETYGVACNIHKGSYRHTSSEGCLTIWPDQYTEWISIVESQMEWYDQQVIPVCLIEY